MKHFIAAAALSVFASSAMAQGAGIADDGGLDAVAPISVSHVDDRTGLGINVGASTLGFTVEPNWRIEARNIVRRAAAETGGGGIMSLPAGMPWHEAILEGDGVEHIRFVIHPRDDGTWVVSTVPLEPGSFEARLDLPEAWAGLEGEALQRASGIETAVFCHAKRFIAVTGSGADAEKMASRALELAPDALAQLEA